nr:MAG TPA: hypothetical protein [Caudoviricetes sp.]
MEIMYYILNLKMLMVMKPILLENLELYLYLKVIIKILIQ